MNVELKAIWKPQNESESVLQFFLVQHLVVLQIYTERYTEHLVFQISSNIHRDSLNSGEWVKNLFSRKIKTCFYWRHLLKCNHSKLKVHRVCRQTCDGDRIRGNQCNASDYSSLETRKISYYGDPCTMYNCSPSTPWMTSSSSSLLYFFQIASML